ncbi:hypothetical protein GW17_00054840 [Ensete ventricosum]|nr:hypothetical protein GW17_00054840 [Ensete ventricosum]
MTGERVTDQTWTQDQAFTSGQGLDDVEGARREFARRFTEGIGKLARNTSGDRWRKTVRLADWNARGYRITGAVWLNCPYPGIWALSTVDPPRTTGELLISEFSG